MENVEKMHASQGVGHVRNHQEMEGKKEMEERPKISECKSSSLASGLFNTEGTLQGPRRAIVSFILLIMGCSSDVYGYGFESGFDTQ